MILANTQEIRSIVDNGSVEAVYHFEGKGSNWTSVGLQERVTHILQRHLSVVSGLDALLIPEDGERRPV